MYAPVSTHIICSIRYLIFFVCLLSLSEVTGQPPVISSSTGERKKIEVLGADRFEFRTEEDSRKRKLIGNVRLKHEDALMWCSSAVLFMEYNYVEAEGRIHINKSDTINIYGDKLVYYGDTKSGRITGNVELYDKTMVLKTPTLEYDLDKDIGYFMQGGTMTTDSTSLTSETGTYYHQSNLAFFKGKVVMNNPRFTMYADSMRYNTEKQIAYFTGPTRIVEKDGNVIYCESGYYDTRNDLAKFGDNIRMSKGNSILEAKNLDYDQKKKSGIAEGNVYWQDTVETVEIFSGNAVYKEDSSYVKSFGDPLLVDADGEDTLYLSADTLISYSYLKPFDSTSLLLAPGDSLTAMEQDTLPDSSDSIRVFFAYNHVKLLRKNMSALCDSLYYSSLDSTYKLYGMPILWVDSTQFTSDSVYLRTGSKKIQQITLFDKALILQWSDTNGVFNQTAGRRVDGYFEEDSLRKMIVQGNAQSIFFVKDDSSRYIGANKADCAAITAYFAENTVQRIVFENQPTAVFTPIRQVDFGTFRLDGFNWQWEKKPKNKYDIIRNNNPFQTFHLEKRDGNISGNPVLPTEIIAPSIPKEPLPLNQFPFMKKE